MQNFSIERGCDCPWECNSVSYSFSLVSTPFNLDDMCPGNNIATDFLMKEFYEHKFPSKFMRNLIQYENNNISSSDGEYCKAYLQYRAEVVFRLATETVAVTVTSRRLSFFDKLSTFGKVNINVSKHLLF